MNIQHLNIKVTGHQRLFLEILAKGENTTPEKLAQRIVGHTLDRMALRSLKTDPTLT